MKNGGVPNLFQDWFWAIGLFSVFLLYVKYWYQRPYKFPPGPRGIPILGCTSLFGKNLGYEIFKLSQTYGPILSIRLGWKDAVFLNDFTSIEKVSLLK